MSKKDDLSADHISWLVNSRSRNQQASLQLYLVIKDNEKAASSEWSNSNIAQALIAVCFSLWRAVFLADVNVEMQATVTDAQEFLGNLVLHNVVAYPQDRNNRDWTFIYYVNNARYRLELIASAHPEVLPKAFISGDEDRLNAKDLWTFHQNALDVAIKNFEILLKN
jgi:hypothetical protein